MAGFGWDYLPQGKPPDEAKDLWLSLTKPAGIATMKTQIETVSAITRGTLESDFWTALAGARTALAQQVGAQDSGASTPQSRCQALLWFSDGAFHLTRRTPADRSRKS